MNPIKTIRHIDRHYSVMNSPEWQDLEYFINKKFTSKIEHDLYRAERKLELLNDAIVIYRIHRMGRDESY